MYLSRLSVFLFVVFLAKCHGDYLKYEVDGVVCGGQPIRMWSLNESLLLQSSQLVPKSCKVTIVRPPFADGLVVVVQNVSIDNAIHGGCDNYIQFGSSSEAKWCQSSDARSLVFTDTRLEIEFNLDNNSDYYFNLVVTAYKKSARDTGPTGESCDTSAPFMCRSSSDDNQLCISDAFRCDGLKNCPQGFDETQCATTFEPEVKVGTESAVPTTESAFPTTEWINKKFFDVTDPIDMTTGIRSTFFAADGGYQTYNIKDFCNKKVEALELMPVGNGTAVPAILQLTASDAETMNGTECIIRFSLPSSTFMNEKGLIVSIDYLNLTSDKCQDYIEIKSSISGSPVKWCSNKTDEKGVSYKGGASGQVDIKFQSAINAGSSFRLVVTQYQDKTSIFSTSYCYSNKEMKCKNSNDECVSKELICDGHRNCPSGEDEDNCGVKPTPAPVTTTTSKPTTTSPSTTTSTSTTTTTPASTTTTAQSTTTSATPTTTKASTTTPPPTTTTSASTTTGASTTTDHSTTTSGNITTPVTSTTAKPEPSPEPSHMSGGMIALTVIGVLVAVGLIVCALYIVRRRRGNVGYNPLN